MKKETKKHLQKYCDISNWSRMHRPSRGKKNYEEAEALAEEIIDLMLLDREPDYDGVAVIMAALAMVRAYAREAQVFSPAFDYESKVFLSEKYEELFKHDWWINGAEFHVLHKLELFIRNVKSKKV